MTAWHVWGFVFLFVALCVVVVLLDWFARRKSGWESLMPLWLLGVWSALKSVPWYVYGFGVAFCLGGCTCHSAHNRFPRLMDKAPRLFAPAEGEQVAPPEIDWARLQPTVTVAAVVEPCPVNGPTCQCGCQSGKPCNCALSHVAVERLTRRTGFDAYCDLVNALRPGDKITVYVNHNPPAGVANAVRYDGYPNAAGRRFVVYGHIQPNGDPKDDYAKYLDAAPVAYYQPLQPFGGNCPSGNCRSR